MRRAEKAWPCMVCERLYVTLERAERCEQAHAREHHERERGEDDGLEYGHPADRLAGRE